VATGYNGMGLYTIVLLDNMYLLKYISGGYIQIKEEEVV